MALGKSMHVRAIFLTVIIGLVLNAAFTPGSLQAQQDAPVKLALVIGVGDYLGDGGAISRAPSGSGFLSDLKNPPNDADAISRTLRSVGFKVTTVLDPDRSALIAALAAFEATAASAGENPFVLIYYSGHGLQIDGANYLVPARAKLPQADLSRLPAADVRDMLGGDLVPMSSVLRRFPEGSGGANVLILDACRNNPWDTAIRPATRASESLFGLAPINAPTDTLIIYSASPGKVASDGLGDTSPFTTAFIGLAMRRDLSVTDLLGEVRAKVRDETQGTQDPWMEGTPPRRLCLPGCEVRQSASGVQQAAEGMRVASADTQAQAELRFWDYIKDQPEPDLFEEYLQKVADRSFPGTFTTLAQRRATSLRATLLLASNNGTSQIASGRGAQIPSTPSTGGDIVRETVGIVEEEKTRARGAYADGDYTAAFAAFRKAAEAGDVSAAGSLGYMYAAGEGVERNDKLAFEWYQKSALGGDRTAMVNLGVFFEMGRGVKADPKQANIWYRKAADAGNPVGMRFLGMNYQAGLGTAKDAAQANAWFRKASDLGDAESTRRLGLLIEEGIGVTADPVAANGLYRVAADLGDVVAMRYLGINYESGIGTRLDYAVAAQWYRRGAEAGDAPSMRKIGQYFEMGRGVQKDPAQAYAWYSKGAAAGDAAAMGAVGVAYATGFGVAKDQAAAITWYRKAADLGDSTAMTNLGVLIETGTSAGAADPKEANVWYRKAADGGNARAMRYLAFNYEGGIGFATDLKEAAAWYRRGSAVNDVVCIRFLGIYTEEGKGGIKQDPKEANALYQRAADLGDVVALRFLGQNTESGLGFAAPNPQAANALYLQASEGGDAVAMRFLGINYISAIGTPKNEELAKTWLRRAVEAGDEKAKEILAQIE